uniref:Retrovirus-related Pol polyprotein from transposon TNT 1-94 n=1 Tax=Tanacetum cinerariifolium TaxID=118510 RepID=A0A6L2LMP2_TANCI|nr:retrovirus-related Pol polyprotein from transposon TNT 1-94 [Tanacetum cinerariifolium]
MVVASKVLMLKPITTVVEGVETIIAPATAEEKAQRRLELKAIEKRESTRRNVPVKTTNSTALVSYDGLGGYDWSDQVEEDLTMHLWHSLLQVLIMRCKEEFYPPLIEDWISDSEDEAESGPKIKKKTVKPSLAKMEFVKSIEQIMKKLIEDMLPSVVTLKEGKSLAKNSVHFTDIECVVLSPDVKLPDENHVLLSVPRNNNMYSVDLKNIIPKGAERRNRTLIKAARTMLADSKLPTTFWAEAVSTACYVQNRTTDPPFPQEPKSSQDDGFKPYNDIGNKVNKVPRHENEYKDQEEKDNVNSTNRVNAISSKWVFKNKLDIRGIMIRSKARLMAQGHTQEDGIDYNDVFALVARIEAIRLFIAYDSFKDFVVYRMDVKTAFIYEKTEEAVYICRPLRFEDLDFPEKVYKVEKALYELHQAPRACARSKLWLQTSQLKLSISLLLVAVLNTMCIVKNLIFHSKTKHIEIRHHFIRDSNEKKLIQMIKIHIDKNVVDLLTKTFDVKNINGEAQLHAKVDGKKVVISEASIRKDLQFGDEGGIDCLPN